MRVTLLLVLLALLALTWWALRSPETGGEPPPAPGSQLVDYFVEGLDLTTFAADGTPLRRLQAEKLRHYRGSGETRLARPRFTLFQKEQALWHIRAANGTLTEDHSRLRLAGEVEIRRSASATGPPFELHTRDLLVKPRQEYAETAAPVRITSSDNWITAVGMQAWLRPPGRIRFLSQTRAHYAGK